MMKDHKDESKIEELIFMAFDDVREAYSIISTEDNQYNRRAYIRSAFAAVEALTYVIKQKCLSETSIRRGLFNEAEIALLKEETYGLNNKAEAITKNNYLPTADNFRFALSMYLRNSSTFKLDLSDGGWEFFNKALKIRHRIVHPKDPSDFLINDTDLETVHKGYSWFNWVVISAFVNAVEYLRNERDYLEAIFEERTKNKPVNE
ncbi:hypothetical protein D3C76_1103770 [compost metagenome]